MDEKKVIREMLVEAQRDIETWLQDINNSIFRAMSGYGLKDDFYDDFYYFDLKSVEDIGASVSIHDMGDSGYTPMQDVYDIANKYENITNKERLQIADEFTGIYEKILSSLQEVNILSEFDGEAVWCYLNTNKNYRIMVFIDKA